MMPLDNVTQVPLHEPEPPKGESWAAVGHKGVVLQVTRHEDGTAAFCTFNKDDDETRIYAMHLSQVALMDLLGFLVNRPRETN